MWGKTRVDESFPSVEMRVVSPSVESVMKLLLCSTFFFEVVIQMLTDGGWRQRQNDTFQHKIKSTRTTKILFKNERETSPIQWVTGTNCTRNLFTEKKWQKCHLLVNEIQKNFILIVFFSRISVFQLKDKKAKTNRVSFVASSGKAKGATSVSAQL